MAADNDRSPKDQAPSNRRARRHPEASSPSEHSNPSPYSQSVGRDGQPSPYTQDAQPPSPYQQAAGEDGTTRPSPYTGTGGSRAGGHRDLRRPAATRGRNRLRIPRNGFGHLLAGALDRRRDRRVFTFGQRAIGLAAATGLVLTGVVVSAEASNAEVPLTRETISSSGRWAWYNEPLGTTVSNDQYAQARITGLRSREHFAGFLLRHASKDDKVLVAVSGTQWKIKGSGDRNLTGTFPHSSSGLFRAEIQGQTVRILWDGAVVTSQKLTDVYTGKGIVASIWQSSRSVRMFNLQASSLSTTPTPVKTTKGAKPTQTTQTSRPAQKVRPTRVTKTTQLIVRPTRVTKTTPIVRPTRLTLSPLPTTPSPLPTTPSPLPTTPSPLPTTTSPSAPAGDGHWYSGAAGSDMANGNWEKWRGSPAGIAGTWDDTRAAQTELYSICGGQYTSWDRPLDLAIGGIYESAGESWSAAASGAYDSRWTQVLTLAKKCWGTRPAGNLYIRFAHEMNLSNDWRVAAGEEANFVTTFRRIAGIRDQVFPGAKLAFSPNEGSANGSGDVRQLWPGKNANGKNYADIYAVDVYNWYPWADTPEEFQSKINQVASNGAPIGIEQHRLFAESLGTSFAISEWSNNGDPNSNGGGGEAPIYVQELNKWLRGHAGDPTNPQPGQVVYDVQFNLWREYQFWADTIQPKTAAAYTTLPWG